MDILEDGSLDQREDLLAARRGGGQRPLQAADAGRADDPADGGRDRNPHVDVLGHCTGRIGPNRQGRAPESEFDAEIVFAACRDGVAVEVNCRPERSDPPDRLLKLAVEAGCEFAIDTDAHAPGQLDWLVNGTVRAERAGITADRVINTCSTDEMTGGRAATDA